MTYKHNQVVSGPCDGVVVLIHKREDAEFKWERYRCIKCNIIMETPAKHDTIPHGRAYEMKGIQ